MTSPVVCLHNKTRNYLRQSNPCLGAIPRVIPPCGSVDHKWLETSLVAKVPGYKQERKMVWMVYAHSHLDDHSGAQRHPVGASDPKSPAAKTPVSSGFSIVLTC